MKGITGRFVLLIGTAAVAPLVIYGIVSVNSLRAGTQRTVGEGNLAIAREVAERIHQYFDNNVRVLKSVGTEVQGSQLELWQQTRILRNHVLDFPEFREISLFDRSGRQIATSRTREAGVSPPAPGTLKPGSFTVALPHRDKDLLPTTTIAVPLEDGSKESGTIVAEISLEELWRTVDRIKVGNEGYALLMDEESKIIAHGNANDKNLIAQGSAASAEQQALAAKLRQDNNALAYTEIPDRRDHPVLAAAAVLTQPNWTVIVEQPTAEAYAVARRLESQLTIVIGLALLGTVALGWFWARSFITRIFALTRATRALAEGRMDERVALSGSDEIRQLGDSFNSMADRLVELQDAIRKQERQVMFGRIAAGLVHDLSHPIQNIVNNCKLILKMYQDEEYRDEFRRIVEREGTIIKRVLDDLRNIARPMPLERFPVDVNRTIAEAAEAMQQHAETAGLTLRTELSPEPAFIEGDVFALGRVYRNLMLNAIQATAPGGLIVAATEVHDERVQIRIFDTGCGIPPERLAAIFEDFVTTKRRGLGLGLAISKKIVEQLGGEISVASEVGKGTTFALEFPRTRSRPMAVAG
jgi:signal transduction histidine kinase